MMSEPFVCRVCGSPHLEPILSLGQTPLANALIATGDAIVREPTWPLDLVFCPQCSLVQITVTVPPEQLFSDYVYFSSYSETMLRHARTLSETLIERRRLNSDSLVIEAASNDGYLLQNYVRAGVPVLGIEPAENVCQVARERGVPSVCEFFGRQFAVQLRNEGQLADVFHAHNVLAHVSNLNGFVAGIRLVLKPDGVAVIEVPYIKSMLDGCEFDTIYHEHLCYFSLSALNRLFRRQGLLIEEVELQPIHGGSLRLFAVLDEPRRQSSESVHKLLAAEQQWGVDNLDVYREFAARVAQLKESLVTLLGNLKWQGNRLAAYGAAAKGSTLLNYLGIGTETLDYVVDRSPHKQGKWLPGVRLPIHGPEKLLQERPDYVLLLAWNFADEIMEQQAECHRRGARFIVPIPILKVI